MNTNTHNQPAHAATRTPRWSKEQIRAARMAAIAPVLEKRGMRLNETGGGNYTIRERPDIIIKGSYWRSPGRGAGGNAIDLLMQELRMGFNDAMRELMQAQEAQQGEITPEPP